MRHSFWSICVLTLASAVSAQTAQPSAQTSEKPADVKSQAEAAKPANTGPAVDDARVTGSTFQSTYFKFSYDLPKDWKALDDATRMAANRRLQDEDKVRSRGTVPAPVSKPGTAKPAPKKKPTVAIPGVSLENYALMVASSSDVTGLDSIVLPRLNIWAHKRIPPLDGMSDPAQFMVSMRRSVVLSAPHEVVFDGHKFIRADIETPSGEYRSQFVTVMGDYLVGFDFHSDSQRESALLVDSMKAVKFQ
jgi:hypothetical protein